MTTSGVSTFNPVRDTIIKGALRLIGAYPARSIPKPHQVSDALEALNMLLKSWQVEGFLWLKEFATLDLIAEQASYDLPGAGFTGSGRPTRLFNLTRVDSSGNAIPLGEDGRPISRREYQEIPVKDSPGPPLKVYYDPQLSIGKLYVWPVPVDNSYKLEFTCDRPIQDILEDENTFDVPPEQIRRIKYALALELAPEYALPVSEYDRLAARYETIAKALTDFDQETSAIQIMPGGSR